jgi:hypothetical protein
MLFKIDLFVDEVSISLRVVFIISAMFGLDVQRFIGVNKEDKWGRK